MINGFTSVIFDPGQKEIARVNRIDGTLYLKPQIWDNLPQGEKDFVLWHEKGHIVLQTTDEYKANKYAVKNFLPSHTLSNPELKARITIMQSILTPGREKPSPISGYGVDPVSNIAGAIGSIFESLPVLGIGSKARIKEQQAAAQAQGEIIAAQSAAEEKARKTYMVWGILAAAFILVMVILYFVLRKK